MTNLPAILEGPAWLAGHWSVQERILTLTCQLHCAPYEDQRKWGERAAAHWASLPPDSVMALKPEWLGVRGMDIGRRLDDGTLVGCTKAEFLRGMKRGVFSIDGEVDRLIAATEPCRAIFVHGADKAERIIPVNCEPSSDPLGRVHPESLVKADGEADDAFARRQEAAALNWEAWEEWLAGRPMGTDDIRRFNQAKVNTIRASLKAAGLLVPDVTVVPSFAFFGSRAAYAVGHNDEELAAINRPRDPGVKWASNWQWYGTGNHTVTQAALFAREATGLVFPTVWPFGEFRRIVRRGVRGGVIFWIDEDQRARMEGRADKNGESMLSADDRRASESWMADMAAWLTRELREVAA